MLGVGLAGPWLPPKADDEASERRLLMSGVDDCDDLESCDILVGGRRRGLGLVGTDGESGLLARSRPGGWYNGESGSTRPALLAADEDEIKLGELTDRVPKWPDRGLREVVERVVDTAVDAVETVRLRTETDEPS